ncbi:MAG TPA: hypothetical protein VGG72_22665 [Bryobacteraceae bacterium]
MRTARKTEPVRPPTKLFLVGIEGPACEIACPNVPGMIGTMIRDKPVLGLIGKYLRLGAMADGIGRGGPLSAAGQHLSGCTG